MSSRFRRTHLKRRVICFAVAFNLFYGLGPGLFTQNIISAASEGGSARNFIPTSYEAYFLRSLFSQAVSLLATTLWRTALSSRQDTLDPIKYVGYVDETVPSPRLPQIISTHNSA